eukprot:3950252-Prorocentrum_lima.AAC.1
MLGPCSRQSFLLLAIHHELSAGVEPGCSVRTVRPRSAASSSGRLLQNQSVASASFRTRRLPRPAVPEAGGAERAVAWKHDRLQSLPPSAQKALA